MGDLAITAVFLIGAGCGWIVRGGFDRALQLAFTRILASSFGKKHVLETLAKGIRKLENPAHD